METLRRIAHIALIVRDYDEAIAFYVDKLGFYLIEDTMLSDAKRWVLVSPSRESGICLLLAKAVGEEQISRIGNQTGGRVFLFMHTNDFDRDFQRLLNNDIAIIRQPVVESWGRVVVFADIYGNLWDLIERPA